MHFLLSNFNANAVAKIVAINLISNRQNEKKIFFIFSICVTWYHCKLQARPTLVFENDIKVCPFLMHNIKEKIDKLF